RETAEGEEGHVSDAQGRKLVDQGVVGPLDEVIVILYANDFGDAARLRDLSGCGVADAEMADQTLFPQLRERGERLLNRSFPRFVDPPHEPQIDNVQHV